MFKKLSVIALLALVLIPAGVFAAGTQAQGAGSGTMSAGGQQSQQQSDGTQVQGQYSYCNQIGFETNADTGNGTLARDRTCEQLQTRTMTQLQTQSQLQSQNLLQSGTGDGTGEQLQTRNQTRIQQQLCTMTSEQFRTMTRLQSRLMDGSCGNYPRLTAVTL